MSLTSTTIHLKSLSFQSTSFIFNEPLSVVATMLESADAALVTLELDSEQIVMLPVSGESLDAALNMLAHSFYVSWASARENCEHDEMAALALAVIEECCLVTTSSLN